MKLPWFLVLLAACSSSLREENRQLEDEVARLEKERDEAKFWLAQYRRTCWDGGISANASKGADGKIVATEGTKITISVGSEDGVRVGDTYHLRRGAYYVGQMRIDKVDAKTAKGVFDEEFKGDGAPPRVGDTAYTGNGC